MKKWRWWGKKKKEPAGITGCCFGCWSIDLRERETGWNLNSIFFFSFHFSSSFAFSSQALDTHILQFSPNIHLSVFGRFSGRSSQWELLFSSTFILSFTLVLPSIESCFLSLRIWRQPSLSIPRKQFSSVNMRDEQERSRRDKRRVRS